MIGLVEWVTTDPAVAYLIGDVSAGVSVLPVDDAAVLTGVSQLQLPDGTIVNVDSVDADADTITLTAGLASGLSDADPLLVYPLSEAKWAGVNISPDDQASEPVKCRVPMTALAYRALADGIRAPEEREQVNIVLSPEPMVIDNPNEDGSFDGSYIDPSTTIPPGALTDGIPPSGSPTPTLETFAVGGLRWKVDPVANADPVKFRVYADTVDPPTIDAAHQVYDGSATSGSFAAINSVPLLPAAPEDAIPSYYVACIEYDADGDGPTSATSTAASPRRATTPDISTDWLYANGIQANQIEAGTFEADLALVGRFIAAGGLMEIDGDGTITIRSATTGEDLIVLSPNGSVFRGQVIADDVSVLNGLILQGTASHVAQNAGMTLDNTVNNPPLSPSLTVTPQTQTWPALPSGYVSRGICWDGVRSAWLEVLQRTSDKYHFVRIVSTAGAQTGTFSLAKVPDPYGSGTIYVSMNSVVRPGSSSYMYVMGKPAGEWRLIKYNASTGAFVAYSDPLNETLYPAVGYGGSELVVANTHGTDTDLWIDAYDTSTLLPTGSSYSIASGAVGMSFGYLGRDSFDFGADRFVVQQGFYVGVYQISGSTLSGVSKEFTTVTGGGLSWGPSTSAFYSTHGTGILYKYSSYYPAASEAAYVTYADTDTGSSKHTTDSPQDGVSVDARRYVQATLGPAPSGAATPRVYMGLSTTGSVGSTGLLLRSDTLTGRTMLIDPSVAGGRALVRTANVTTVQVASNVATLTTSAAHNLEVGDTITVASVPTDTFFNGTFTITAVTSTTLSYALVHADTGPTSRTGTITNSDTNTFGSGTPAWIKSQIGGLELYGDGTFKVGTYPITGAWTSYTPTWTGSISNPVINNGTITGKYQRIGNTVLFRVRIVVGSTTTFGSGTYSISIPSTPAMGAGYEIFNGLLFDTSASARYRLTPFASSSGGLPTNVFLFCDSTTAGNPVRGVTPTVPFTLATGDEISLTGVYEAA